MIQVVPSFQQRVLFDAQEASLSGRLLLGMVGCVAVYIMKVTAAVESNFISFAALINIAAGKNEFYFLRQKLFE